MKRPWNCLVIAFVCGVPLRLLAWWDVGHMAVAQIAYERLTPATRAWADSLVAVLAANYTETGSFVEAATWPDDIKKHGVGAYSTWHYTNIPLNDDGVAIACNATPEVDVVWAINQARTILTSPKAIPIEKAMYLAFLIHFVGDLHQPLHSTSMYTNALPGGDQGGNLFPLSDKDHSNLHKLWDDGCGYFEPFGKIERPPLQADAADILKKIAVDATIAYPEKSIVGIESLDPAQWARESHELAVTYGYKGVQSVDGKGKKVGLKPNDSPTKLYLEAGRKIVQMRVAAAGYRLAVILNGCVVRQH